MTSRSSASCRRGVRKNKAALRAFHATKSRDGRASLGKTRDRRVGDLPCLRASPRRLRGSRRDDADARARKKREADAPIGAGRRGARRDVSHVSPEPGPGPDVPKNPKTRRAMAFSERTRGPSTSVEAGRDVDVSRASASRTAEPRRATCSYLLVGLAVLRRPRELRGAKAEVKQTLALGVEEQVGLRVHLGQAHAVTGIDLQAREPAHLGLENHLAPLCVERTFARQREG